MTTHRPVGELNLPGFTLHCWRRGARASLREIIDGLGAISPYGLQHALEIAVGERLAESLGTRDFGVTGQDFARLIDPERFRPCNAEDVTTIASRCLAASDHWGDAAAIAALAAACELGHTAVAGAWAYGLLESAPREPDGTLTPTRTLVAADDIGVLLAGADPETRRVYGREACQRAIAASNLTAQNAVLLFYVNRARTMGYESQRRMLSNNLKEVLPLVPWVSPKVEQLIRAAFGTLIRLPSAA